MHDLAGSKLSGQAREKTILRGGGRTSSGTTIEQEGTRRLEARRGTQAEGTEETRNTKEQGRGDAPPNLKVWAGLLGYNKVFSEASKLKN